MSVVLDAVGPLGQPVALKVMQMPPEEDEALTRRFLREAQILAKLDHRGIVGLYDAGVADGRLYLAMHRLEGTSLRDVRRERPFELPELLPIAVDLADAVAHLHSYGIVHRDLKPANILIDRQHRPVIADFGISRAEDLTSLTAQGDLLGSPGYIAPEIIEGAAPSPASDQFALCRVLFELGAKGPSPRVLLDLPLLEMLAKSLEIDWARWPKGEGWDELGEILRRGLSPDPAARFLTVSGLASALASLERSARQGSSSSPELPLFDATHELKTQVVEAPAIGELQSSATDQAGGDKATVDAKEALPARGLRLPHPSVLKRENPTEEPRPLAAVIAQLERTSAPAEPSPAQRPSAEGLVALTTPPREPADRQERQLAALKEQVVVLRESARKAHLRGLLVTAAASLAVGIGVGAAFPRSPRPTPTVVLHAPALPMPTAIDDALKKAQPNDTDLIDAQGMLLGAQEALREKDFERATNYLRVCIEIADLADCHKLLAAYLGLIGDPTARSHLDRYLELAPGAGDAATIRSALEGGP